jgi:hypothetical protein
MQSDQEIPRTFKTEQALNEFLATIPPDKIINDGLEPFALYYIAVGTQAHLGVVGIKPGREDVWHNKLAENWKRFPPGHYHGEDNKYFIYKSATPPQHTTPIPNNRHHQELTKIRQEP